MVELSASELLERPVNPLSENSALNSLALYRSTHTYFYYNLIFVNNTMFTENVVTL